MGDYNLGPIGLIIWNVQVARNYKLGPITNFGWFFQKTIVEKIGDLLLKYRQKRQPTLIKWKTRQFIAIYWYTNDLFMIFSEILSLRYITTQYSFHVSRYMTYHQYLSKILSLGWIGFRFTFMHKGVLVIMQNFIEVSEQGLWIGLTN